MPLNWCCIWRIIYRVWILARIVARFRSRFPGFVPRLQDYLVQGGFRLLKHPLFFTSSVFIKKPQRVEAIALVMVVTLLVYSLGQRKLRAQLAPTNHMVLDQKHRPTGNSTFRWIW